MDGWQLKQNDSKTSEIYIDFSQVILKNQQNADLKSKTAICLNQSGFSLLFHNLGGGGGKAEFTDDCEPSID